MTWGRLQSPLAAWAFAGPDDHVSVLVGATKWDPWECFRNRDLLGTFRCHPVVSPSPLVELTTPCISDRFGRNRSGGALKTFGESGCSRGRNHAAMYGQTCKGLQDVVGRWQAVGLKTSEKIGETRELVQAL